MRPRARPAASLPALLRDQRYRRHFLRDDGRLTAVLMAAVAASYALSTPNDLQVLRDTPLLAVSLASRAALLVAAAIAIALLRRARSPQALDRATNLGLAATAIFVSAIHLTQIPSGRIQAPLVAGGTYLGLLYFAQRGPIPPRAVAGAVSVLVSGALVVFGNARGSIEPTASVGVVLALLVLDVVGVAAAHAFEGQRRRRFEAERDLRLRLVELSAEKERAESMSRARTAFIAAMSHEFRTPMNAVIGLSDLLLDRPLAAVDRARIRTIHDSARALLRLLTDILDFAKIDAQMLTLSPVPFDLGRLLESVAEMLGPAAEARGLAFTVDVAPGLPACVLGDDARLRQVLVNLAANAVKFTERGSVALRVAARPSGAGEHEVTFRVEDTGIGMSPEALGRLFRPFEQADPRRARRRTGTGLGLAISKQIVAAMGGDLRAESVPERGTTFSFTLRFPAVAAPEPKSAGPSPPRPPLVILVVDDHPVNREVAGAQLSRLGYAPDLAVCGEDAIEAAAARDYDLIFMDLHMPGMSGLEAVAGIRARLAGRAAPHVVAMTASVLDEDRDACMRAGMVDFLAKPVLAAELDAVLRRVAAARGAVVPEGPERPAIAGGALDRLRALETAGNPALLEELCRTFLADSHSRVAKLRAALGRGDVEEIARVVHPLRAAAATLGASAMAETCARVEVAASERRMDGLDAAIDVVGADLVEVERMLRREVPGLAAPTPRSR